MNLKQGIAVFVIAALISTCFTLPDKRNIGKNKKQINKFGKRLQKILEQKNIIPTNTTESAPLTEANESKGKKNISKNRKNKKNKKKARKLRRKLEKIVMQGKIEPMDISKEIQPGMDGIDINDMLQEKLGRVLTPGNGSVDFLGQGDIMLKPGQEQYFYEQPESEKNAPKDPRIQYNGLRGFPGARWPTNIPVDLSEMENDRFRYYSIYFALKSIERNTCLRFLQRTSQPDYIKYKRLDGCWSYVGKFEGEQTVSIGYGCECRSTIIHETMHALGFFHEQARPDRDNYVDIFYENVMPGFQAQFGKLNPYFIDYLGAGYDYDSIMHYRRIEFAKEEGAITIAAKGNLKRPLGRGCNEDMSVTDRYQLNNMYCNGKQEY